MSSVQIRDVRKSFGNFEVLHGVSIPIEDGEYPTLLSYGPYGKGLAFQEGYKPQWDYMLEKYPEVGQGTTFYIRLPIAGPVAGPETASAAA